MNQEEYEDEQQMRRLDAQEMAQVEGGNKPVSDDKHYVNTGFIPLCPGKCPRPIKF